MIIQILNINKDVGHGGRGIGNVLDIDLAVVPILA